MSLGPAEGRGGAGNTRALLSKMKKASQRSVVEEMATAENADAVTDLAAAGAPPVPLTAAPYAASPVESVIHDSIPPTEVQPEVVAAETPQAPAAPAPVVAPARMRPPAATPEQAPKKEKKAATKKTGFWQTDEQWMRTRSTYDSTRRLTKHKTLSEYAAAAMEMYDRHNEELYNDGQPFDSDPFDIPKGRPLGS